MTNQLEQTIELLTVMADIGDMRPDHLRVVKDALALLKQQRWVSVDERLPDGEHTVLLCRNYNFVDAGCCTYDLDGSREWETKLHVIHNVTHWKPLPEPPQQESNDG